MLGSSLKFEADVLDEATLESLLRAFDRQHHEHLESLTVSMQQVTDQQVTLISQAITLARFKIFSLSLKGLSESQQEMILLSIIGNEDFTEVNVDFDLINLPSKSAISHYIQEKHSPLIVEEEAGLLDRLAALSVVENDVEDPRANDANVEFDLVAEVRSDITNWYQYARDRVHGYLPEMPDLSSISSAFTACSPIKYKPD